MDNGGKAPRILSVRAANGGAHLCLTLDVGEVGAGKEEITLLSARLECLPRVGVITAQQLELLRREGEISTAITVGLRLLSACGTSRLHLVQKLRARGISAECAALAVEELAAKGYLSEADGARREAERDLRKLWGDRRILSDLRAKGYGEDSLGEAMQLLSGENSAERCAKLIRKRRMKLPQNDGELRHLCATLSRYGYTLGEIRGALSRLSHNT